MDTSPTRKMTIMKELKMENQWIWNQCRKTNQHHKTSPYPPHYVKIEHSTYFKYVRVLQSHTQPTMQAKLNDTSKWGLRHLAVKANHLNDSASETWSSNSHLLQYGFNHRFILILCDKDGCRPGQVNSPCAGRRRDPDICQICPQTSHPTFSILPVKGMCTDIC